MQEAIDVKKKRLRSKTTINRPLVGIGSLFWITILAACEPDALRISVQNDSENKQLRGLLSTAKVAESATKSADVDAPSSDIQKRVRENLVYIWRDRHSCSGVLALIPESTPPVEVVLTAGHCIAANPLRRSEKIKTPSFQMNKLSMHKHPRIGPFLTSYFFPNETLDTTAYDVEMIAESTSSEPRPWEFSNDDHLLALYHDDFPLKAAMPMKGSVHKDFFSLFRKVSTPRGDGYINILNHFDLALIPLSPPPPFINLQRAPFRIRPLPKPQRGDKTYRAMLLRDNVKQELKFDMTPVVVTGFSPDHALIQGCETPPKAKRDFKSDAGSALLLERTGEIYLIGIAAFGNPSPVNIGDQNCALTTFTHLDAYSGWMKITSAKLSAP